MWSRFAKRICTTARLLALAQRYRFGCGRRAKVVVNTDVEVAIELNIGLHLPETSPALSHDLANRLGGDVPCRTVDSLAACRPMRMRSTTFCLGMSLRRPASRICNRGDWIKLAKIARTLDEAGLGHRRNYRRQRGQRDRAGRPWNRRYRRDSGSHRPSRGDHGAAKGDRPGGQTSHSTRKDDSNDGHNDDDRPSSLNGKETVLPTGTTISQFLESRALVGKLVVVEINGTIVPRADFDDRVFQSGDLVEVVHFVGGG